MTARTVTFILARDILSQVDQRASHLVRTAPRDVIVVLGMHRSGTSAVAGLLAKLGAAPPRDLMPATSANERGHFESLRLVELNDEMLAAARSRWDDWRRIDPAWFRSARAAAFKGAAGERFETSYGDAPLAVLKDPRICRLAPLWLDALERIGARPHVVIPVRSPLEVAQSLRERDGFPLSKGLLLWLRHVLDAEAATRKLPRSIVIWDDLLADWRGAAEKIAREADLAWSAIPAQTAAAEGFLSDSLRHQRVADALLADHPDIHRWTAKAYEALLRLSRKPQSAKAREVLDRVAKSFNTACEAFGRFFTEQDAAIGELRRDADALTAERERLRVRSEEAAAALGAARLEKAQAVADLESRIAAMAADLAAGSERHATELDRQRAVADDMRRDHEQAIARVEAALAAARLEKDGAVATLEGRLAALQAETAAALARQDDEIERSRAEAGELARQRDESRARAQAAAESLAAARLEKDEAVAALEGRLAAIQSEAAAAEARREDEAARLHADLDGLLRERDEWLARMQRADKALAAARVEKDQAVAALERRLAQMAADMAEASERHARELETQRAAVEGARRNYDEVLSQTQEALAATRIEKKAALSEAEDLRRERDGLLARIQAANEAHLQKERALAELKEALASSRAQMASGLDRHRREIADLRDRADAVLRERDEALARAEALDAELAGARQEKQQALAKLEARAMAAAADADRLLAAGRERIILLEGRVEDLRGQADAVLRERNKALGRAAAVAAELAQVRQEKQRAIAKLEAKAADADRLLADGRERIAVLERRVAELHEAESAASSALREAREATRAAQDRATHLDDELSVALESWRGVRTELDEVRREASERRAAGEKQAAELLSEAALARGDAQRARMEVAMAREQMRHVERARDAVLASTSWRLTEPLRRAAKAMPYPMRLKLLGAARTVKRMIGRRQGS
jgi:hypothetical protein